MKKILVWLLFSSFIFTAFTTNTDLQMARKMYLQAAENEKNCQELIQILANKTKEKNPVLYGYKASATMMMAKYSWNPYQKIKYFSEGKKMLEEAIQASQMNTELRYLRFTIQTNVPAFLGYNNKIESDKDFLITAVAQLQDYNLKELITAYLTNNISKSILLLVILILPPTINFNIFKCNN